MKRILFLSALALLIASPQVKAQTLLVSDDFTYADGSLVPNGGWVGHSGTPGDLLVSGGQALVQHGTPSEDASIAFADQTSGVITAQFDISVSDNTVIGIEDSGVVDPTPDFEYFAHFFTDGSFNFRSRLSVAAPTGAGDYTLGYSSTTSTEEATLTSDFNFGDTVSVVLDYDVAAGTGSLTVGTETILGTSAAVGETINLFAFRQSDSTNNELVSVDNLVITTSNSAVPEPSSLALLGFASLGLISRRRR